MAPRSSPQAKAPGRAREPATEYEAVAQQWARAEAARREKQGGKQGAQPEAAAALEQRRRARLNDGRRRSFERRWRWTVTFWIWLLAVHGVAIWLFASGFLLTRLVLDERSSCAAPPVDGIGSLAIDGGCWHPKTFDRAVVVVIDALRYDFAAPAPAGAPRRQFHDALPFLHETAIASPHNAFLRPFIADPPTTTLQRLKGLTTGTLPTFVDAGSNFAGTAIDEDNLLLQMRAAGKKVAALGDDTWWALFPDVFEANVSRPFDSFNVPDLHTVDDGVAAAIFPLLEPAQRGDWDLLIGHCLGVDHVGHRFGPDHGVMRDKLSQMDAFVRRLADAIDDDTLLVVMGDHGMDAKGDHGGESDDEVSAALWMFSKRPVFGRTRPEHAVPPASAAERPVNQIDLVPTLALLLGLPIPYNNLGLPIEEAFAGPAGDDWANLAAVTRAAAAGIRRYQASYFAARAMEAPTGPGSPAALWSEATAAALPPRAAYAAYAAFQRETLRVCRRLWARFDVPRMVAGIAVAAAGVVLLVAYAARGPDDAYVVSNDAELDYAEKQLELLAAAADDNDNHPDQHHHRDLLRGLWSPRFLVVSGALVAAAVYRGRPADGPAALVAALALATVGSSMRDGGRTLASLAPRGFWGWLAVVFTVGHSLGFASNSYTVWEDSTLLFFMATFGAAAAVASLSMAGSRVDRTMAVYHSVVFAVLGRLASYSKLCREEQMPYCTSTYYASAASSTSAPWQLAIPFAVAAGLPSVVRSFLTPTRSYEGLAPTWIGYVFRGGLAVSAVYWVVDAANAGGWLAGRLPDGALGAAGVYVAQLALAVALVAGTTAFVWSPPCVSVVPAGAARAGGPACVAILGYANALGARYLMLPLNVLAACAALSKPMGQGALALMLWQVLSLVEVLDLNGLKAEPIGPVMLAVLGNFYFFRTGHQAVLSSIQWDSAFIALSGLRYPWAPLAVVANTFAGQLVAAACVPLVALWKTGPRQRGALEAVARAAAVFVAYFAVEAVASMACAAWLRRHLMLYRVFGPRLMLAAALLLVVDVAVVGVALTGVRSNTLAVGDVFGWAE